MSDRIPGSSYENPIWYRGYRIYTADTAPRGLDWAFVHEDHDIGDSRSGYACSIDDAKGEIDWMEEAYA